MQLSVLQADGSSSGASVEVSDATFAAHFNEALVHQVVVAYQAGARAGTRAQKSRSAVSGSGDKPWRQKGTGRARAGSRRSPLWRGGGKVFPATTRNFEQKVNRKMYRAALRSIVSELVRREGLVVLEGLELEAPKTKELLGRLQAVGCDDVLILHEAPSDNLYLAARNLPNVDVCDVAAVDPLSLIHYAKVVCTVAAIKGLEERVQ